MPQSRVRFSIAGLMGLIVGVAFAVAALRDPSEEWAGVMFTAALGLVAIAILGATFRSGLRRAFWAGAALFGGGYLFLCYGPWCDSEVQPHLISTRLLGLAFGRLHTNAATWINSSNLATGTWVITRDPTRGITVVRGPTIDNFQRVGHSLLAIGLALVGGLIARRFADNRADEPDFSMNGGP